jgi:hypothetical protein
MEEAKAKAKAKAEADAAALLVAQGKIAPEPFTENDYPPFSFQKEDDIKLGAAPRNQMRSLVSGSGGDYENEVHSLGSPSSMDSRRPRLFPPYVTPTRSKETCTSALTKCAPSPSRRPACSLSWSPHRCGLPSKAWRRRTITNRTNPSTHIAWFYFTTGPRIGSTALLLGLARSRPSRPQRVRIGCSERVGFTLPLHHTSKRWCVK